MKQRLEWLFQQKFRAEGLSLEKLAALCAHEGIELARIKRQSPKAITGWVPQRDYQKLCDLASQRGWSVSSVGLGGLSLWTAKMKGRWGMAVGCLIMALLIAVALQFIWQVEIIGAGAYEGDVRTCLIQKGVGVGTFKGKLDLKKLQNELEWRYPQVAWVHTSLRGSTLVVRLVEGVPVPEVAPYGAPGDVVAARAGVIVSVEPQAGTPLVKNGDIVKAGQMLIEGLERRGSDEQVTVKARGRILARVWDQVRIRIPATETISHPIGKAHVSQAVTTPWFQFGNLSHPRYDASETLVELWPLGGVWWPVMLRRETCQEVKIEKRPRDVSQTAEEARQAALRLLAEKTGRNDDLVDKWVDCCMIEGGIMEACATGERVIDIAQARPANDP